MRVRLNLNWCFLLFIMLFASCAYAFDVWNLNLPLGIPLMLVVTYLCVSILRRQSIPLYWSKNLVLKGYGVLLIIAMISTMLNGFSPLGLDGLQFFYVPIFVMFFHHVIRSPQVLRKAQNLMGWLFWISFVMFLFQQLVLGTRRDELTGLYGITTGNQGYTNLLLVSYSLYVLSMYLSGRMKLKYAILVMAASLYQAAVGEIKVYFIMMILTAGCQFFMSRLTLRKCGIAVIMLVLGMLAVSVLEIMYPEFANFLSIDSILKVITNKKGYSSSGDINRLNGVLIMRKYMKTPAAFFFGIGAGHAGKGTAFYRSFGWLHYSWFTYSYVFVELGILGLITVLGTHVMDGARLLYRYYLEKDGELKTLYLISFIYTVILVAFVFYNEKQVTLIGAMYSALYISLPSLYSKVHRDSGTAASLPGTETAESESPAEN